MVKEFWGKIEHGLSTTQNWYICQSQIGPFCPISKIWFLAELQARMSRDSRILLFSHHNYQVSLIRTFRQICRHQGFLYFRLFWQILPKIPAMPKILKHHISTLSAICRNSRNIIFQHLWAYRPFRHNLPKIPTCAENAEFIENFQILDMYVNHWANIYK